MPRYFNPTKEETEKIAKDPYVIDLVNKVQAFAYSYCQSKNLYAWKEFIHDLQVDLALFIYDYEIAYHKGIYHKSGFSAYCNAARQQAITWTMYYNTHKRKVNQETLSIEASEDDENSPTIQLPDKENPIADLIELRTIQVEFGDRVGSLCKRLLQGEALNKSELSELRKTEWLKEYLLAK